MSFLTDYKRATGLGSAKSGTRHFIEQRLTAIALVPLGLLFLWGFAKALGSPHTEVLAIYRHPFHAIVAILFLWVMFAHLRLGLQVVIEDYISSHQVRIWALIVNALLWRAAALAAVFAIAKIAISG